MDLYWCSSNDALPNKKAGFEEDNYSKKSYYLDDVVEELLEYHYLETKQDRQYFKLLKDLPSL